MNFKQWLSESDDEEPLLKFNDEIYELRIMFDLDRGFFDAIKDFAIEAEWDSETFKTIKNASIVEDTLQGKLSTVQLIDDYVVPFKKAKKPFVLLRYESVEDEVAEGVIDIHSYYRHEGYFGDEEKLYAINLVTYEIREVKRDLIQQAVIDGTAYQLHRNAARMGKSAALKEYADNGTEIRVWVVFN